MQTCWEKNFLVPSMQNSKVKLTPGIGRPCYKKIDDDGSEIIHCAGTKSFTTFRERWHYITFMNCHYQRNVGINVRYKLHMLNGDRYWNREFSADESCHIFTSIGNVIFTTVLILMGKGYTITRLDIRRLGVAKIIFFVLAYSTTFLTLYILKEKADKRDVKNIYDSEAAIGLVILRFTGLGWILYGVFFTMKNYPKKRAFYLAFTTFSVGWFLSEPFIILLSNYHLPLYCRAKVVHGAYLTVAVLGHGMFLFITRPSTTNTFFPFHLSTNKVGFEVTDEESCASNSGIESDSSYTKYMVEKEQAMDYYRTLEKPSTIQTISKSVSKQDVKISPNIQETPKPTTLTPLQKVFRALEEVDRSIEEDKAAELAQRRKLQAILGCKIGGIYDLEEELSEESISPSKEVTDVTSTERDSNNHPKNAARKDTNTAAALSSDEKPSKKKTITKEEAANIKAKELQDIFVTRRPKETKATHGECSTPNKTAVDTSSSSGKVETLN
ncbi:hypothetical protein HOLleu_41767 [Holothuria leucospilota]|uniref:Intimal thickness related receptor IRP domain-containing protein n=1 Tax=Holothuria leucospilota TaxID=206669 RepID=A0A9Q1B9V2_HOLLE|nr:hypothetical protein HOLleu_41767 [Holothuria leucospilota]